MARSQEGRVVTPNLRLASDPHGQEHKKSHTCHCQGKPSISISADAYDPHSGRVSKGNEKGGGKGEGWKGADET